MAKPILYIQDKGDLAAAHEPAAAAASPATEEIVIGNLRVRPLDMSHEERDIIHADTTQYSITPRTFAYRPFFEDGKSEKCFIDQYKFKDNEVLRFGINGINILPASISEEGFAIAENKGSAAAGAGSRGSSLDGRSEGSIAAKSIKHHSKEIYVMQKALDYLLGDVSKKTVLVDILARKDGEIKLTSDGYPEIHNVLLYKKPKADVSQKHEIIVIDPSNFQFSSHLSNQDMSAQVHHDLLSKITTFTKTTQIYMAQGPTGTNPKEYRDCIDIATKLAFGFNKEEIDTQINDIKSLTASKVVQNISNSVLIDKNIGGEKQSVRVKQASDHKIVQKFNKIEFVINKTMQICFLTGISEERRLEKIQEHVQILDEHGENDGAFIHLVQYNEP